MYTDLSLEEMNGIDWENILEKVDDLVADLAIKDELIKSQKSTIARMIKMLKRMSDMNNKLLEDNETLNKQIDKALQISDGWKEVFNESQDMVKEKEKKIELLEKISCN